MSNSRIVRRLNGELGTDNYTVYEYNDSMSPIKIIYRYRNKDILVNIGSSYPFHQPKTIGDWDHRKYQRLPDYYREYTGKTRCPYCEIMDDWSPGSRIDWMIDQFIKLDRSISNCVKTNILFRNVLCLPEDLIPIILSYLEDIDGLSIGFRACVV